MKVMTGLTAIRAMVVVLLLAVIGLVIGLVLVSSTASSNNASQADQIRSLQAQVRQTQSAVRQAKAAAVSSGQEDVTAVKADVADVKADIETVKTSLAAQGRSTGRRIETIMNCLPEMQTEMGSIDVDKYGYISMNAQVSRPCQKVVYPSPDGG